jgi:predicted MPP superfamily phosphohydrolase
MTRALFFVLFALALLGDARVFLFVINRVVFGGHREEKSRWHWLLYALPPLLLALTVFVAFGKLHALWLIIAAGVGSYWILDRIRVAAFGEPPLDGVRTLPPVDGKFDLEVTRHEVFIDDLPLPFDGYRIAFLTDAHVAPFVRRAYYDEIAALVRRVEPDLILFGGDFVSFRNHIPLLADRLAGLSAKDGVYAVLGNHDYWTDAPRVVATLETIGVRFLTNAHATLARDGARLPLAGIDEVYRGAPDLDAAFDGIAVGAPCIAFTHHPDMIDRVRRRVDLLLCGHTHGGQIRFPFFGAVVVPSKHEAKYASGFHRLGAVLMYVSRGIGAIPPVRILCRPEIATFTLRRS